MVIDVINVKNVATLEPKYDTPVATDRDRPDSFEIPGQLVQGQTWQRHVLG
jgi:hypothetical protein